MRISYTLVFICALEASFWLVTSTASPDPELADIRDELSNRLSQHVSTSPQDEISTPTYSPPEIVAQGTTPPDPACIVPKHHDNQHHTADERCSTKSGIADGPSEQRPKRGKSSLALEEEKHSFLGSFSACLSPSLLLGLLTSSVLLALTTHVPSPLRLSSYDTVTALWNACGAFAWYTAGCSLLLLIATIHPVLIVLELLTAAAWGYWMVMGRPTSMPGPAREQPISREASWDPAPTHRYSGAWTFATGQESHDVAPDSSKLTGEPAGRHLWYTAGSATEYPAFNCAGNPNTSDLVFREQMIAKWKGSKPDPECKPSTAQEAARKGVQFYQMLQCEDGHWAGDYGGPHFLMPGLICVWYITGCSDALLSPQHREAMMHYMRVHQQADGGWGTHIESPSTMFGTMLNYVALRLLGEAADSPQALKAQQFIRQQGGALYTASWAKFWLCCLGLMEWGGHNSVPAELWILPSWLPFHPGRMWCHARMVYLPMSYLYGMRFRYPQADTDPVIAALRQEIYVLEKDSKDGSYEGIDWVRTRHWVADMDNYSPKPWFMAMLEDVLAKYWECDATRSQGWAKKLRAKGLDFAMRYMQAEDVQTNFIDIGPVNKVMNMLCVYHNSGLKICKDFESHMARVPDYLWIAEDGMKMQGYNGSQSWDTSFAMQAVSEAGLADSFEGLTTGVWNYLERTQILSTEISKGSPAFFYESNEQRQNFYRHVSQGGWPFSTSAHGWPITDCTAEGLKAVLCIRQLPCVRAAIQAGTLEDIEPSRLHDACNVLLCMQNAEGGFATYENTRGYGWFEFLNPSEVFGDIMIDYSYVECTSASLHGLAAFHAAFPDHRAAEVSTAMKRGCAFLQSIQREDGSWYGSWACCFTYAAWFAIGGLVVCGQPCESPAIQKCAQFLLKHQNQNGGWGEDFTSCFDKQYCKNGMQRYGDKGSGIIPTAWALLALMDAECNDHEALKRGTAYLMSRQQIDGDWPQEGISGVFNRSCGITYTAYRNVFPIWALGRYATRYESKGK